MLAGLTVVGLATVAALIWVALRVVEASAPDGTATSPGVTLDLAYRPSSLIVMGIGGLLLFVVVADVIGFAVANKQYARNRRARANSHYVDPAQLPDVLPGATVFRDSN